MPWYKRIFIGRYGVKRLSVVLFGLSALFFAWTLIMPPRWNHVSPLISGGVLLALGLWRCFSRNIVRRAQEEQVFDLLFGKIRQGWERLRQRFGNGRFGGKASAWKDKRYIVIRCPRCGQKLRVPRGKGLVRITCRSCAEKFERQV